MTVPVELLRGNPDRLVPIDFVPDRRKELIAALTDRPATGYPSHEHRVFMNSERLGQWFSRGRDYRQTRNGMNLLLTHPNHLDETGINRARPDDGEQDFHHVTFRNSLVAPYQRDSRGVPIHPEYELLLQYGAVTGLGWYWDYGPNPSANAIYFGRDKKGRLNILVGKKHGRTFLPGGMMEVGETPTMTVIRETQEETGVTAEPAYTYELPAKFLGSGRTTLNAWEESASVLISLKDPHIENHRVHFDPKELDHAEWLPLNKELLNQLFLPHANDVRLAVLEYERREGIRIAPDGSIHPLLPRIQP